MPLIALEAPAELTLCTPGPALREFQKWAGSGELHGSSRMELSTPRAGRGLGQGLASSLSLQGS